MEAVVAYEITQVASLDVALTTWVIALTAEVSRTMADPHRVAALAADVQRAASRAGCGAGRCADSAAARDRAAIAMSKNPAALVAALERLADDPRRRRRG